MKYNCPVCGKVLIEEYVGYMDHILCEYEYNCADDHFYDIYSYGNYQTMVKSPSGEWQNFYFSYSTTTEDRNEIDREMREFIATFRSKDGTADKGEYERLCQSHSPDAQTASEEPRQTECGVQPPSEDKGLLGEHHG